MWDVRHSIEQEVDRVLATLRPMARPESPNEKFAAEHTKKLRAEGSAAFAAGKAFADNPNPKHTPDHAQWMRGWIDAQVAAKSAGR